MATENLDKQKRKLESKIAELEEKLSELGNRLRDVEHERQHEAIDHLDVYLQEVDTKYTDMKKLWDLTLREIRDRFQRDISKD